MTAGRALSRDDINEILFALADGESVAAVAERYGVTRVAIYKQARKHGIDLRNVPSAVKR